MDYRESSVRRCVLVLALLGVVSACASAPEAPLVVTVPYDVDDYDQRAVRLAATEQCKAKGFTGASETYRQPEMRAGWGYKAFACY